jgi:hypothetical protein
MVTPAGTDSGLSVGVRLRRARLLREGVGIEYTFSDIHGATDSSKKWVPSLPGCFTVGSCAGSTGKRSTYVMSALDPGAFETKRTEGSSWPM